MSCMRCAAKLLTKSPAVDGIVSLPGPLLQSVRGIRPRWLPKSKSKIFYVRTPTPIDPEEYVQLKTLYSHYKSKMKSVRSFITKEHLRQFHAAKQRTIEQEDKAAEFRDMEEEVKLWNSRVEVVREERQAQEAKWERQRVEWDMTRVERKKLRRLERAEQKLQSNIEEAPKFITMENLDIEIEKLLNMRSDYNFAIDKQGNRVSADSEDSKDSKKGSEQKEATTG